MNLADASPSIFDFSWPAALVMERVTAIADGPLAESAYRIDREGYYPLDVMASLGKAGAFGAHLGLNGGRYGLALDAMRAISRRCGSTGFLTWSHDVCGLYMEQSGNPALTGDALQNHMLGRTFGGTALSNPMKALAGIEKMLLRATKVPGGYRVSGALPWVSHIAPGQYCGAIAAVYHEDGSRSHEIMFMLRCTGDVALRQCPEFSGMEGTSTWGVRLDGLFVGENDIIADPAQPFIARIRAAFVLLQIGMATGIVQGSIDSMREVEPLLGHVNQFLQDRPDELQAEYEELEARVARLALTPYDGSKDYLLDVLDARTQGSELALRASQSALLHQGARGYLLSSAPQRRVREAHFAAIVTPAIKHLRWEMARLSKEEVPA
ncbi:acyl-CoA dehydrogenase family protein [Cupriavidus metallidurans]|uniref:acyl-CoA dehydrogenase family protein n=1 Tax=Cupriavidus metallidurans TaxID=119219 RepID=UPI000CE0612D|nr:acyl-CoA dehydrogenase family protein [Cupriavidus metallidurans]AVA35856.1 acyl-CoA dehydrogenase [Cupriavidus metallidurans]